MATCRATILVASLCLAANAVAQLNVLTTREAQRILDLVPAVTESKARGGCPSYSITEQTTIDLSIQVREACPPAGVASNLLGNYVINRKTGAVAEGLDTESLGPRIATPEIDSLTSDLVRRARGRVLNAKEAECLVLEAARSSLSESTGTFSAAKLTDTRRERRFSVEHRIPNTPGVAVKFFTVRSDTAGIRDDSSGNPVISSGLALLTSRLLSNRESSGLSVDDTLAIAFHIPTLASSVAKGCSELVSSGDGTSDEMYIGLRTWCPGAPKTISVVAAVNPSNGRVTDPKTQKSLDSPESEKIARQILEHQHERLEQDKTALAAACKL
jgi:hypothetical protein